MNGDYLPPRLLQVVGILILVFSFGFWAVTGRASPLFVGAALTLMAVGAYRSATNELRRTGS